MPSNQDIAFLDPGTKRFVERQLKNVKDGSKRVLTQSLNDSGKLARKMTVAAAKLDIRQRVGRLKEKIKGPETPGNRATFSKQRAIVSSKLQGDLLSRYITGKNQRGVGGAGGDSRNVVKVKVKPRGRAKKMPDAFILTLRNAVDKEGNSKTNIFIRDPVTGKLLSLYGPSPSQVMRRELATGLADKINVKTGPILLKRLNKELQRIF